MYWELVTCAVCLRGVLVIDDISTIKIDRLKNYKYTVDGGSFTEEDKKFYEDNGYILIRNMIQSDILEDCRNRAKELCVEGMPKGWAKVTVDEDLNWVEIEDILWDPIFSKLALNPKLLNAVESITGPNIVAVDSKLFQSPEGKIDIPYSREMSKILMRPENSICCTWTTVENLGEDKRSLRLVPGTHQLQMNNIRTNKKKYFFINKLRFGRLSILRGREKLKIRDLPSDIVLEVRKILL